METRRYAIRSLADITLQSDSDELMLREWTLALSWEDNAEQVVSTEQLSSAVLALINAMSDYSTDQRGDVGSWIRVAAVLSLGNITAHFAIQSSANTSPPFSQEVFDKFNSGLVKLLVEKLEPVRAAAARSWGSMKSAGVGNIWAWPEEDLVEVSLDEP